MEQQAWLADRFEENRGHLRAVAYRILGSLNEADDAIQEAWLRLSRSGAEGIDNLGGWLTTVVARICLDHLRTRASRREEPLETRPERQRNPEQEALLADSVGVALLVVLDRLSPAERLAYVLHDILAVPFEEIAPIVGRSEVAVRQLASRARRRVQGAGSAEERAAHRELVGVFLHALRAGDVEGLVSVLDPDLVVRIEGTPAREVRGARNWAPQAIAFAAAARFVQIAIVDGEFGFVLAPYGRLSRALRLTITDNRITEIDILSDPDRLAALELGIVID